MKKQFKGDIIITDPCYILKDEDSRRSRSMSGLGMKTYLVRDTIYGDWSCTTLNPDKMEVLKALMPKLNEMYNDTFSNYNNPLICKNDEDKKRTYQEYEKQRKKLEEESGAILGHFCADGGMVGVFLLEEVLAYNPDFDYHINKPWTTTWIKDFDGEVEIETVNLNNDKDVEVRVVGKGNINFYTTQTGF